MFRKSRQAERLTSDLLIHEFSGKYFYSPMRLVKKWGGVRWVWLLPPPFYVCSSIITRYLVRFFLSLYWLLFNISLTFTTNTAISALLMRTSVLHFIYFSVCITTLEGNRNAKEGKTMLLYFHSKFTILRDRFQDGLVIS